MPQINQLALVAYSQFFWLLLVLALIYFGIGHAMLPKIQSTVDARDKRITDDLAAAQAARTAADETEAAYRARMDASRAEAMQVAQAARRASAKATEERMHAANAESGECYDGLMPGGVNYNQGAESVLAFHLATCSIRKLCGVQQTGRSPEVAAA